MTNPLDELLYQAQRNKKKGIAVISTEYVIKKMNEYKKSKEGLREKQI